MTLLLITILLVFFIKMKKKKKGLLLSLNKKRSELISYFSKLDSFKETFMIYSIFTKDLLKNFLIL